MMQEGSIDGIVCCSPTFTHKEIVEQAAEYGLDVFCEKPVDESAAKIEELFDIANDANIQLCCGFQRRFDPSYQQALQAIHSGQIGNPIAASVFFGDHPVPPKEFLLQGGGDIFMDLSAHDVDYILQALRDQEVTSVYATGTSSTPELERAGVHDNATMVMKFSRGECGSCPFRCSIVISKRNSVRASLFPPNILNRHGRDIVHEPFRFVWLRSTLRSVWQRGYGPSRQHSRNFDGGVNLSRHSSLQIPMFLPPMLPPGIWN
jgi:predicted dehydrogenase